MAGFRYALPEISNGSYFEPLMRWTYSFAGDPTKKNINNLRLAPMVNFSLPDRWFFTLYPSTDIRWNFGDAVTGQTGRLFLPFDAQIGKKFSDLFNVSLEVGVPIIKQYPVYNFVTALRFNLTVFDREPGGMGRLSWQEEPATIRGTACDERGTRRRDLLRHGEGVPARGPCLRQTL